jgi:hypothetical protein
LPPVQHPLPASLPRPLTDQPAKSSPPQPEQQPPPQPSPAEQPPQPLPARQPPPRQPLSREKHLPGHGTARRRAGLRVPVILAVVAVLVIAAIVAVILSQQGSGAAAGDAARPGGQGAFRQAAAARSQAARWVSRQVSRSAIVACDPAMCAALHADGLAAASLLELSSTAADPLGADVVVATPAIRAQFGARLASVYAPAVLARFGAGTAQIDVRVVAPGGAAAYRTALSQDVLARKRVAAQLLGNRRIQVSPAARAELTAGQVDARLLLMLPALANIHPVQVLAFGDAGPGADLDLPLTSAELAGSDHPKAMSQAGYVSWLETFLRGQRPPYNSVVSTVQVQGQPVVDVQFAMPGPLGLIKSSA